MITRQMLKLYFHFSSMLNALLTYFKAKILNPKYINNFPKVVVPNTGQKFSKIAWVTSAEHFNKAADLLCN